MAEPIAGASPRFRARIACALWLTIIVASSFAEFFVRGKLASVLRLAMVAILGTNLLNLFAPLVLLKSTSLLAAFKADQLQALAFVSVKLYAQIFFIALLFFGLHCLLLGYLVYRSTFLPRIVGGLMMITGLCYLTHSFANVLFPALASRLFTYPMPLGLPGEFSLTLWLLVIGVNVRRWGDRAAAA